MTIQIFSGVPLAPRRGGGGGGGGRKSKYPFASMEVDHSFFIASDTPAKTAKSVYSTVRNFAKKHDGYKFAVRTLLDGAVYGQPGVGGVQVVRIAA